MPENTVQVQVETLRQLLRQLSNSRFGKLLGSIDAADAHTVVDLWREEQPS